MSSKSCWVLQSFEHTRRSLLLRATIKGLKEVSDTSLKEFSEHEFALRGAVNQTVKSTDANTVYGSSTTVHLDEN